MSRQNIDLTKPLSEDDRLYLESRSMTAQLDENAMHLMGGGSDETAPEQQEQQGGQQTPPAAPAASEPYEGVTVPELKAAIEARNEGREDTAKIAVAEPGNRPEIVAALVADDAAIAAAEAAQA